MHEHIIYVILLLIFLNILCYNLRYKCNCDLYFTNGIYVDDFMFCRDIYRNGLNKKYYVIKNLVSQTKCDDILTEGIEYAKKNKWTTQRHDNYPTTDNEVTKKWKSYDYLHNKVNNIIFPKIAEMYNIDKNNLHIKELFLVKYEDTKQNKLDAHTDGNEFSFVLALNSPEEYEGGGTYFVNQQKKVILNKGDCLVFCGQNKHQGLPVIKGKRFILAGFIYYKTDEHCEQLLN